MTKTAQWTVAELVEGIDLGSASKLFFKLPSFQRSIAWDEERQHKLIASLQRDWPIGTLLLYKDLANPVPNKETYFVLDGLQRLTALKMHRDSDLLSLELEALEATQLRAFRTAVINVSRAQVAPQDSDVDEGLSDWLNQTQRSSKCDAVFLLDYLEASTLLACDTRDTTLRSLSVDLVNAIKRMADISAKPIPALVYDGDPKYLSDIFVRINTQGIMLSPYDILNALWDGDITHVPDPEIVRAIEARYELVRAEGYEIGPTPGGGEGFNLYEYMLGLGKTLYDDSFAPPTSAKRSALLPKRARNDQADALIFNLAAGVHGLHPTEVSKLNLRVNRDAHATGVPPRNVAEMSAFQDAVIFSCNWVADYLQPYFGFNLKGVKGGVPHTILQLASIIGRVVVARYEPRSWSPATSWPADEQKLKRNLIRHYVRDVLDRAWSGSGDTRMMDRIWANYSKIDWTNAATLTPSSYYMTDVDDRDVEDALRRYFRICKERRTRQRASATAVDRMVLMLAYGKKMQLATTQKQLDIEHVVPVDRFKGFTAFQNSDDGWAINATGNLAFLDTRVNRSKKTQTISEFLYEKIDGDSVSGTALANEVQSEFLFSDWAEVPAKPEPGRMSPPLTSGYTEAEYETFLDANAAAMTQLVLDRLL